MFASNTVAAGTRTFELDRIMGTSVGMIEEHYGVLIDTAHNGILARLEASSDERPRHRRRRVACRPSSDCRGPFREAICVVCFVECASDLPSAAFGARSGHNP
jgi:hypothetical protein